MSLSIAQVTMLVTQLWIMDKERQDRSPSNDLVSLYPRIQLGTDNTLPARLGTNRMIKLPFVRGGGETTQ